MSNSFAQGHKLTIKNLDDDLEICLRLRTWKWFDILFAAWFVIWAFMLAVSINQIFSGVEIQRYFATFFFLAFICPLLMSLHWISSMTRQPRTFAIGLLPYFLWKRFGDQVLKIEGAEAVWQVRIKRMIFHSEKIPASILSDTGSVIWVDGRVEPYASGWFAQDPSCIKVQRGEDNLEIFWGVQNDNAHNIITLLNDRLKKSTS